MTKKDCTQIADILNYRYNVYNDINGSDAFAANKIISANAKMLAIIDLVADFSYAFSQTNEKFDSEKFMATCLRKDTNAIQG